LCNAHSNNQLPYRGEVEFITQADWDEELDTLLEDLQTQDGRAILHVSDPAAYNFGSFSKLYAIYGDYYTHSSEWTGEMGPGNRKIYKAPPVDELKAKLRRHTAITRFCGQTISETARSAPAFASKLERYMDSANEVSAGSYWPLVKKVRAYSSNWEILKTGAVLVDAPGVHDDNSARDRVVKTALKDADMIWIVSNINRAVNDKTAKDLLSHQFRSQLLMDGSYDRLCFIATQSDVIQASEVRSMLDLPRGASVSECAAARNQFTRDRLQRDFLDGLIEMAENAGEEVDRDELARKYRLPIFTVSSTDYQKLVGIRDVDLDGPPQAWSAIESTEIPALRRHVHKSSLGQRKRLVRRQAESLTRFGQALLEFCDAPNLPTGIAGKAKVAFDKTVEALGGQLDRELKGFSATVSTSFRDQVAPQLEAGASQSSREALSTAEKWGAKQSQGGLHWATYKACLRRLGVWRIEMNEELAEPIFKAVSTGWERVFIGKLNTELLNLQKSLLASLGSVLDECHAKMTEVGVPEERLAGVRALVEATLKAQIRSASEQVRSQVSARQKDLSRSMVPLIQAQMTPAYTAGAEEKGTGSHARRIAIVEGHIGSTAPRMFKEAVGPVAGSITDLVAEMREIFHTESLSQVEACLRVNYCGTWEEATPPVREARKAIRARLATAVTEARGALTRLLRSQGEKPAANPAAGGMDGDSDEELLDMTEIMLQKKKEFAAKSRIDLCGDEDDDDEEGGAAADGDGPQAARLGHFPATVKAEPIRQASAACKQERVQ